MTRKISVRDAAEAITDRAEFIANGGSMSGTQGSTGVGRLPHEWAELYRELAEAGRIRYTVQSYATPIGWDALVGDELVSVVPLVKYSQTTSNHQHAARYGLGRHLETLESAREMFHES